MYYTHQVVSGHKFSEVMNTKAIFFLLVIGFSHYAAAQDKKMEREKRIKKEEIPPAALKLLEDQLSKAKKTRYFLETDIDHMSYEIKFLLEGNAYSVEFDSNGQLEDVEMLVNFTKLKSELKDRIRDHLKQYDNFKIKKVQKQFSSGSQSDEEVINAAMQNLPTETVRYEMIVETKAKGSWKIYEMLFDDSGNFISQKRVVGRLEDNILY